MSPLHAGCCCAPATGRAGAASKLLICGRRAAGEHATVSTDMPRHRAQHSAAGHHTTAADRVAQVWCGQLANKPAPAACPAGDAQCPRLAAARARGIRAEHHACCGAAKQRQVFPHQRPQTCGEETRCAQLASSTHACLLLGLEWCQHIGLQPGQSCARDRLLQGACMLSFHPAPCRVPRCHPIRVC